MDGAAAGTGTAWGVLVYRDAPVNGSAYPLVGGGCEDEPPVYLEAPVYGST
jgi:hypothetical protein